MERRQTDGAATAKSTFPMIQPTHESRKEGNFNIVKMATAPAVLSSITVSTAGLTKSSIRSQEATPTRKRKRRSRPIANESQSERSAGFWESVGIRSTGGLKKGRETDSVAEGFQSAEEGNVLELDECWRYVRRQPKNDGSLT